jgi:hypothetical protein
MDLLPALVTDGQAAEPIQPGQRALGHPAIAAQPCRRLNAFPGNPCLNPALAQGLPAVRVVIALIRMQFGWALARPTTRPLDRFHRIHQCREDGVVRAVRTSHANGQGDPLPVDQHMALRARFAAIRRVRAGRGAPPLAGTLALSALARDQSMRSAPPSRFSRTRCRRCQTPAAIQSRRRRQHVTPLPQPSSWGSSSQGMPLLSTKRIPVSAARSGIRGRPPCGFGDSDGNSGAIAAHRSSLTSGLAISSPSILHGKASKDDARVLKGALILQLHFARGSRIMPGAERRVWWWRR